MKIQNILKYGSFLMIMTLVLGCEQKESPVKSISGFELVPDSITHIEFQNFFTETPEFNFINYPYLYSGVGTAVLDINNDGLQDILFLSNLGSNKLYLNQGNFSFQDITQSAGLDDPTGWCTGVSVVDINNDGWTDIYISRSAAVGYPEYRYNQLYINQKNNTFKESSAAWGLAHLGYSTQSYFFDYDKDGDLDMYQLNHRIDFQNNGKINSKIMSNIEALTSDHLYENTGYTFVDVTQKAGTYNKAWGLSCSIGDFNNDNWPDIYVANDYLEPDILYINQKDGTFKDEILNAFSHISFYSMGSDIGDMNNDGYNDLIVLDMMADDHIRGKENMASMSTSDFLEMVKNGFHYQYMTNALHLNMKNGSYTDVGQFSGISKSDWSWAPLIGDYNNDGLNDLYVTNGIYKDVGNRDFNIQMAKDQAKGVVYDLQELINSMPSQKLINPLYINQGELHFKNSASKYGIANPTFTSGAAYADLNNDGALDLILNNTADKAMILKNKSTGNYLTIDLKGNAPNTMAIGAKVEISYDGQTQQKELYTTRGYLSSVDHRIHFGLGSQKTIDEVKITWPNGKNTVLKKVAANQILQVNEQDASQLIASKKQQVNELFKSSNSFELGINYAHLENDYDDYMDQLLLPQKKSTLGPCSAVADLNSDGKEDIILGGSYNKPAMIFIQGENGAFVSTNLDLLENDKAYEDQEILLFDADQDNDLDILIGSGSYEFKEGSELQLDRLYLNDGTGTFTKAQNFPSIKTNTKALEAIDYDQDGDLDLLIGSNVIGGKYPFSPTSYILENNEGTFSDVTQEVAPDFVSAGMIYDLTAMDYDQDGDQDFFAIGEWMPITLFENQNGQFNKKILAEFAELTGWWYKIEAVDLNEDGQKDLLVGNLGTNNKFNPKGNNSFHVYCNDFDDNGSFDIVLSKDNNGTMLPVRGRECSSQQVPQIAADFQTYSDFAHADLYSIYGQDKLDDGIHLTCNTFESVMLLNNADGTFKVKALPAQAQFGPSLDFLVKDFDQDGHVDILGVGAIYNTEVETIRYDSNKGYLLKGNGKGDFKAIDDTGLFLNANSKTVENLRIGDKTFIIVANNHNYLSMLEWIK